MVAGDRLFSLGHCSPDLIPVEKELSVFLVESAVLQMVFALTRFAGRGVGERRCGDRGN